MTYRTKKPLVELLPKTFTAGVKKTRAADSTSTSILVEKKSKSSSGKRILAVTSDPDSYTIPEHLLSVDHAKPRILKSCTRCRKQKTKCNYMETAPHACSSCSKKVLNCEFEIVIPVKRSEMVRSLDDSVGDLRIMVNQLIAQEKLLRSACEARGITVEGLVDVESMDYSSMHRWDDYSYDEYEEEEFDDNNDDEDDKDMEEDIVTISPSLLENTGLTTPLTSPSTTPVHTDYTHDLKELIVINNDNTPVMSSLDDEVPIKEELFLSESDTTGRPTKVTLFN